MGSAATSTSRPATTIRPPRGCTRTSVSSPRSTAWGRDRKSTRLNSSHRCISYAVFCLKKKKMVISWNKGVAAHGEVRTPLCHARDVGTTLLDELRVSAPEAHTDVEQRLTCS